MRNELLEQRRAQVFPTLTARQLSRLEPQGVRLNARAGEILGELGAPSRGMFVVEAGSIEVLASSRAADAVDGYERLFLLTPGEFTGELSTLCGTSPIVRIRMLEAGTVLVVTPEQLRRIVQSDAELSELFMRAFILRRMSVIASGLSEVLLLGSDHSGHTLLLREFLTRNARPHVTMDIDRDLDAAPLLERFHIGSDDVPVVICRDGEVLRNPSIGILADRLGINAPLADEWVHDVLIVGGGPAGLAAAVYAASEGLDVRVLEAFAPGGQAGTSSRIENYLGFPTGISGAALAGRAFSQALKFGAQPSVAWRATRLCCDQWPYSIEMADGRTVRGRTVVIATGAQYRTLDIANLAQFLGRGVYYAATHLEATLCTGEDAAVVGGGNSAGPGSRFPRRNVPARSHADSLRRPRGEHVPSISCGGSNRRPTSLCTRGPSCRRSTGRSGSNEWAGRAATTNLMCRASGTCS